MSNVIYITTFKPHLNTNYPKYYIGSKYNYIGNYFGSVSSRQIFEYTNGQPLHLWWKEQLKDTNNFDFEVLEVCNESITPQDLVLIEREYHMNYNVLGVDYFNQAVATTGFVSVKKSKETKRVMSEKTKAYWDSAAGQEKKLRLIERNKTTHSEVMKKRFENKDHRIQISNTMKENWKNPSDKRKAAIYPGRKAGIKNKKIRTNARKCIILGVTYDSAYQAAKIINQTPSYVSARCNSKIWPEWMWL